VKKPAYALIGCLILTWVLTSALAPLLLSSGSASRTSIALPETRLIQDDYMSALLARNADPLGLKENPELQRLLSQPSIKWAVRSKRKHILN